MTGEERLLIFDDDPLVAQVVALVAEDIGIPSQLAPDAQGFFAAIAEWQPTHIVLDMMMPGMDGLEVMRRLAERNCRAKLIILSGLGTSTLDEVRRSGIAQGLDVVGALPKPFRPAGLHALLRPAVSPHPQ